MDGPPAAYNLHYSARVYAGPGSGVVQQQQQQQPPYDMAGSYVLYNPGIPSCQHRHHHLLLHTHHNYHHQHHIHRQSILSMDTAPTSPRSVDEYRRCRMDAYQSAHYTAMGFGDDELFCPKALLKLSHLILTNSVSDKDGANFPHSSKRPPSDGIVSVSQTLFRELQQYPPYYTIKHHPSLDVNPPFSAAATAETNPAPSPDAGPWAAAAAAAVPAPRLLYSLSASAAGAAAPRPLACGQRRHSDYRAGIALSAPGGEFRYGVPAPESVPPGAVGAATHNPHYVHGYQPRQQQFQRQLYAPPNTQQQPALDVCAAADEEKHQAVVHPARDAAGSRGGGGNGGAQQARGRAGAHECMAAEASFGAAGAGTAASARDLSDPTSTAAPTITAYAAPDDGGGNDRFQKPESGRLSAWAGPDRHADVNVAAAKGAQQRHQHVGPDGGRPRSAAAKPRGASLDHHHHHLLQCAAADSPAAPGWPGTEPPPSSMSSSATSGSRATLLERLRYSPRPTGAAGPDAAAAAAAEASERGRARKPHRPGSTGRAVAAAAAGGPEEAKARGTEPDAPRHEGNNYHHGRAPTPRPPAHSGRNPARPPLPTYAGTTGFLHAATDGVSHACQRPAAAACGRSGRARCAAGRAGSPARKAAASQNHNHSASHRHHHHHHRPPHGNGNANWWRRGDARS
ncbi:MAG: hypothetical protein BJ554DRAFT_3143 [Olpidium bornovanus]|uniref:Uncharacterized protein n=1 Tax=Olpidium bornovanus TaxID=278681 RepID=A0A8H8DGE2_9FUNG|nr:MAG: hypothetical protein BJ554DRAFT_3143 [Olpidium bornovanus]